MAEPAKSQSVDFENHAEFFQIRGQNYTLVTLRVIEPDDHQFFMELHKEIGRAPDFFKNAPVVVDVGPIADRKPTNLAEFSRRLRQLQLVPVGIQNGGDDWNRVAINAGLGVFPAGRQASTQRTPAAGDRASTVDDRRQEAVEPARPATPPAQPAAAPAASMIVAEPVRAGQQIYAKNTDLVVLAQVQPGAELMADGNIHIYSSLRGRAHAGVGGNVGARIFCRSMEAQLISIAGIYLVNEEIEQQFLGQPVQIGCQSETIVMEKLP
ncbi:MAG: septum site-determining protein MinC [Geminicoccaceae bacterium]